MMQRSPTDVRDKRVTLMGLGRFGGGIGVARWLVEQGAVLTITDRDPLEKLAGSVAQLDGLPITFRLGGHRPEDFADAELLVTSPAVSPSNPFLQQVAAAGVPITTEICLFVERCPAPCVGITGTKGKSTTTALLGRMLDVRYRTWVGGNIGKSLLAELPNMRPDDRVVLELSSFMLHYLGLRRWSPRVAVVTMLSRDHLEWHGSAEAYLDAKMNIVRYQTADGVAVLNRTDPAAAAFADLTAGRVIDYGIERPVRTPLPGAHNQLNARAAIAAAEAMGVSFGDAEAAIADFHGMPHRLHLVHEANGVRWIDDSIATIPDAAVAALRAFPARRVIQIVGGSDKGLSMDSLADALAADAKAVLGIGHLGPALAASVRSRGHGEVHDCGGMSTAVEMARKLAFPGDVVLLSTGCASYDQYANFEKRGDDFAERARQSNPSSDIERPS